MNNSNIEIAVIGLGRFGLFWAEELSKYAPIYCYDTDESKIELVKSFGSFVTLGECFKKDFIFITIPIRETEKFLRINSENFKPKTVLVDCSSVKIEIQKWYEQFVPNNVEYTLLHPLLGPDSAKENLTGHAIAHTGGRIKTDNWNYLYDLFKSKMGLNLIEMTPNDHDRTMAYNLSLVHLLGRTLNELSICDIPLKMNALKHLSQTTEFVMNDKLELFQDFFRYNPFAEEIREQFIKSFNFIGEKYLVDDNKINSEFGGKTNKKASFL
ncbi:prephenate dehydrogenase/arogenate dehydrogenase family protein [Bacteroidota bacterium]